MALAAGLHAVVGGDSHVWLAMGESLAGLVGDIPFHWWLAAASNATLFYVSSSSVLLTFGLWVDLYPRLFVGITAASAVHTMLAMWDARHGWPFRSLWVAYGYFVSAAIVAVCLFAVWKALSSGFLSSRLFGCAVCLWLVYVSSTVAVYLRIGTQFSSPPVILALVGAMMFVPLAATAVAPVALASHRHA